MKLIISATLLGLVLAMPTARAQSYAAGTWDDDSVHLLDAGLNDISSFSSGASDPNGVAFGNGLIFAAHFNTQELVALNLAGVEQYRWSNSDLSRAQGMAWVNGELAVSTTSEINYHDPVTGVITNTITPAGVRGTEGMVYDGTNLWLLDDEINSVNPATGAINFSIPNAASNEQFTGTGIALGGPGELILAATDGDWYRVSMADGSVISSGNNGLNMYGLTNLIPEPTSATLLAFGVVLTSYRRRRWE